MSALRTIALISRDHDRLKGVHPDLVEAVVKILDAMDILGWPMFVTDAVRTQAQQQALYAQGRTAPGRTVTNADGVTNRSNHQVHSDGWGHAVDCAFLDDPATPTVEMYDDRSPWKLYGLIAQTLGLKWGGNWAAFPDLPHVELP
jgi:peptidoglycan L-alanyl-D-glutamate endopeptidase CwlK